MKRSHFVSIMKIVTLLLLTGACAACAGGLSQTPSASEANLDNDAPKSKSSSGSDVSPEQRNREIVQSVTGRTM